MVSCGVVLLVQLAPIAGRRRGGWQELLQLLEDFLGPLRDRLPFLGLGRLVDELRAVRHVLPVWRWGRTARRRRGG